MPMTKLSVNVNKLATIRNSRGKNNPDVTAFAERILDLGAHGITVHPRPDGRHIRHQDVLSLHALLGSWNRQNATTEMTRAEFNIEGYPSPDFMEMIEQVRPDQCTLVPDPPEALTSNAGWNLRTREAELSGILQDLKNWNVRSSVFVDPQDFDLDFTAALGRLHPQRIELYTERFAETFGTPLASESVDLYKRAAQIARDLEIGVNAGHDLNQKNLDALIRAIPWIEEVSIGHALICEALEDGMPTTIRNYLQTLKAFAAAEL